MAPVRYRLQKTAPSVRPWRAACRRRAITQERLFPGLQGDGDVPTVQGRNVPGIVKKSENSHVLTISTNTNTGTMLNTETNNIPLKAGMYAGGIVGYCEKNSNLIIKNCKNTGNISYADSGSDRSVLLEVYAKVMKSAKRAYRMKGRVLSCIWSAASSVSTWKIRSSITVRIPEVCPAIPESAVWLV